MPQQVTFNIKLNVNGQQQVTQVTADVNELADALGRVPQGANQIRASLMNLSNTVSVMQNVSNAVGNIASTLNSLTEESRAFSGAMAQANTMAGLSGEQFAQLKDEVSELGKQIPLTREELANGLYQVISNGVPKDNWITYLQQSAKASVGGIADLGETVKVTSTIIKNYGLAWNDAEAVQDKIQLTAKNGVTSFEQLAAALPRVSGNAATLGVSIDDLMATFATLTGVSGNTAEVSTQLAAVFTALVKPSSEAAKQAAAMGIEFDAASIKAAGGLQNFLTQLDSAVTDYAGKTGQLKDTIYANLFGSAESLRAITPLVGELKDKFAENAEQMQNSAGTIDDAFSTMASTGSSKLQMLRNSIVGVSDAIAKATGPVMPLINISATALVSVMAVMQLVTTVRSLNIATRAASVATALFSAAQASFAAVGKVVTAVMAGQAVSMAVLRKAIMGVILSTGLVGVAYMALSAIIDGVASHFNLLGNATDGAGESMERARQQADELKKSVSSQMGKYNEAIATCKNFKGSKQEEEKIVRQLNATYGESMGYFKTVNEWYNALTRNSQAYCNMLVNQIKMQQLAQNVAETDADIRKIRYNDDGSLKKYSTKRTVDVQYTGGTAGQAGGNNVRTTVLPSDQDKANRHLSRLFRDRKRMMDELNKLAGTTTTMPDRGADKDPYAGTPAAPSSSSGKKGRSAASQRLSLVQNPATRGDYANNSRYYQQQIDSLDIKSPDFAKQANKLAQLKQKADQAVEEYKAASEPHGEIIPAVIDTKQTQKSFQDSLSKIELDPLKETVDLDVLPQDEKKLKEKLKDLGDSMKANLGGPVAQGAAQWKQLGDYLDAGGKNSTAAAAAMTMLGQSMQQMGADGPVAKVGATLAAIGQIALGFASAAASPAVTSTGWGWLAFVGAGLAAMATTIATIQSYATGGIVPGTSYTGDKVRANVNSGEMILNRQQQTRLFKIANGQFSAVQPQAVQPVAVTANTAPLSGAGMLTGAAVAFRISGRDLVGVLANETRTTAKTGKRTQIKI